MAVQQSPSLSSTATDPLRVFKFEVLFHPPQALAASLGVSASSSFSYGFMTVSGPAVNIEVIPYREGGMNTSQPLSSLIRMSDGTWKRMGDLQVGDRLVDPAGEESKITGVYPRGKKPVYRLTLADGSTAEASDEHLWEVETISHGTRKVLTTLDLIREIERGHGVRLPEMQPMRFDAHDELPVDPYTLGVLISEGALSSGGVRFTQNAASTDMLERISAALPAGHMLKSRTDSRGITTHAITIGNHGRGAQNQVMEGLRMLGLYGHRAWEKFIPDVYKHASIADRQALLQGIMDGDGHVSLRRDVGKPDGTRIKVTFSSASERLRDDVAELISSLGGRCTRGEVKNVRYTSPTQREFKSGRPAYTLPSIQMQLNPFYMERKASLFKSQNAAYHRKITSIEYLREDYVQCIKVSAASELYVTDSNMITHNTTQKMPGQADFGAITMSHGVKMAASQMDILWMSQLFTVMQGSGNQAPGAEFRMICDVYVLDHPVTTVSAPVKAAFRLYNTWPSSLAFSDFDAGANAFLIAQMSLAYEGFDVLVAAGSGTNEVSFSQ